jgi:two-component system OmpR family sensor kinase
VTLRAKIVALVLGLTAAILAALWVFLSRSWTGWSVEAVDKDLLDRAAALADRIELEHGALELDDPDELPQARDPAHPVRIVGAAGVVFQSGPALPWPAPVAGAAGPASDAVSDASGRPWRVVSAPFATGDRRHGGRRAAPFTVQVAGEPAPHGALEERFRRGLLAALAAALVLGGAGAAALAHVSLRPLRRMASEVDAIGAASLDRRIGIAGLDPELGRVATAFNDLLGRLDAAMRAQRELVARASHALRTPIATILTRSEVALRRERDAGAYRDALQDVAAAARDSATLVGHLLRLSRLDESRAPAREDVPLAHAAAGVVRLLAPHAEDAGVALEVEVPQGLSARAEPAALRELLEALVDNAIRYTPRGGRAGLRAGATPGGCAITVWDTGPGIPAGERSKVFERFYRGTAAEAAGQPGSGLGLAIVKAIADAHGAAVELGENAGGGLAVTVELPARD